MSEVGKSPGEQGVLPDGWRAVRLMHLARVSVSNVDKHTLPGQQRVRLCNYTDVYKNETIVDNLPFTWASASADQVRSFSLEPGDTLFTKDSETAADIGVPAFVESAGSDLICGYHLAIARPRRSRADPRFLFWAMSSERVREQWEVAATGVTRVGLRQNDLRRVEILVPSTIEQRMIGGFLDRQSAMIDALIAKQQQLIVRLEERKRALVDTLVWHGLDHARRSGTGIDPAPDAPDHWVRAQNRRILRERVSLSTTGVEEMLSVSHITGVTPRAEKNVTMFEAETTVGYRLVSPGDLAINTMWAWMGALGVSRHEGMVSPAYGVYAFHEDVDVRYFEYLYRSRPYVAEMTRHSRGIWSSRLRLYPGSFLRLGVVVPPREEQTRIADHLDDKLAKSDALIAKTQRFIQLSKERRAALVTAAVTGQIDDWGTAA